MNGEATICGEPLSRTPCLEFSFVPEKRFLQRFSDGTSRGNKEALSIQDLEEALGVAVGKIDDFLNTHKALA
jgi:hypothetical protein